VSECLDCKKSFDEISLTWVPQRGKLVLLCDECNDNRERERKDSPKELGTRNMDGQQ
tara:strand:+ start:436 stop:606 length:171 start_codon:yes stop_codon:yes gene_type:complete